MPSNDTAERNENTARRTGIMMLFFMVLVFIVLSAFSFVSSRDQVDPANIDYAATYNAVDGKRIFQAYNCMGCHTIVGNGAYLGPDLTNTFETAGPAFLAAFIPSAGTWPTEAALRVQIAQPEQVAETGIDNLADYYAAYPGAKERIERRGGQRTLMPNLSFREGEVPDLIAFFKYTSAMDTEGWPPTPKVDGLKFDMATPYPVTAVASTEPAATAAPAAESAGTDLAAQGEQLAQDYGCFACHATDTSRLVGPGWGGIYGATHELDDGTSVVVDDAYLHEAIVDPNAQVVAGYAPGLMPSFASLLDDDEINAIIAFIRSLENP